MTPVRIWRLAVRRTGIFTNEFINSKKLKMMKALMYNKIVLWGIVAASLFWFGYDIWSVFFEDVKDVEAFFIFAMPSVTGISMVAASFLRMRGDEHSKWCIALDGLALLCIIYIIWVMLRSW